MNETAKYIKKFVSENREFRAVRVKNRKLEVELTGRNSATYVTADFSPRSEIRAKLEALELKLGVPSTT